MEYRVYLLWIMYISIVLTSIMWILVGYTFVIYMYCMTPLMAAIFKGHDIVKALIETALHLAAQQGKVDVVRLLIESKAQVNIQDKVWVFQKAWHTTHHSYKVLCYNYTTTGNLDCMRPELGHWHAQLTYHCWYWLRGSSRRTWCSVTTDWG